MLDITGRRGDANQLQRGAQDSAAANGREAALVGTDAGALCPYQRDARFRREERLPRSPSSAATSAHRCKCAQNTAGLSRGRKRDDHVSTAEWSAACARERTTPQP